MRDSIRSITGLLVAISGSALALPTQAQAYRVSILESPSGVHAWATSITDSGDVLGRAGDAHAIWQLHPGFGRGEGLTILRETDDTRVRPRLTSHVDLAGFWYGSRNGRASVWSQAGGHEPLEHNPGRSSRVHDGLWPSIAVGYENNELSHAEPVAWIGGVAARLAVPDWANSATAEGVNSTGTIVGTARLISDNFKDLREQGVVWIADEPVELDTLIVGCNLHIARAQDVNENGLIAANLIDDAGVWHAAILVPAGADMNGDGQTTPADFSAWLGLASQGDRRADIDGDGSVSQQDLTALIALLNRPTLQGETESPGDIRETQLSLAMLTDGVYDLDLEFGADDVAFHPIQPGNSAYHNWLKGGNWNQYHPDFNPNCYGCSGDDPNNPHAPDGAPGWPGNDPLSPYKPNGGPGGPGADGNPAGDGGDGGDGAPGNDPKLPGNGGPGGAGGDNTDNGTGGAGGSGGNGGNGDNNQSGGNGGSGGDGGTGGPNGGNSGDGGAGGDGGNGGIGESPSGPGASGGHGGNGGDSGDAPAGDAGEGGNGGTGGNGGNGNGLNEPGGSGGGGGNGGTGGDAPNGNGGNGGDAGNGGSGGNSNNGQGGNGGSGGDGGDGGDGDTSGGSGGDSGIGGSGGAGDPAGSGGSIGNEGNDGTP